MNSKTRYSLLSAWTMSSSLWRSKRSMGITDAVGMTTEIALHDVLILKLFEQTDFSNGSARDTFIFCFQPDLLEGNDLV